MVIDPVALPLHSGSSLGNLDRFGCVRKPLLACARAAAALGG